MACIAKPKLAWDYRIPIVILITSSWLNIYLYIYVIKCGKVKREEFLKKRERERERERVAVATEEEE